MRSRIEFIFDKVAQKISSKEKDITSFKTVLGNCELQGKAVLEVGCGLGDNLIYCVQKGAGYAEGFDISNESIKLAKSKTKTLPNIIFHKCSLEDYKTEKKFDFILGWGIFEYLEDPLKSLKKMCCFLADKGTMILLISKPIFVKRISFLCRIPLSKVPLKAVLPITSLIRKVLKVFNSILKKMLYVGQSNTYTIEQTILEALMVPRYNVFHPRIFTNYLQKERFLTEFFNGIAPSMVCIVAKKNCREKQRL